jgi:hypothetical protein
MYRVIVLAITLFHFSFDQTVVGEEQKIVDRIQFVASLKQTVDETVWKTLNDKRYHVPLVYFTDSACYVANPTKAFLATFNSRKVFENEQLTIYKTKRIDNVPFHMETGMTLGDSSNEYNYHSPFMMCSSYEEVVKTIPSVLSTEEWATMIMHEYFHGFQYKHQAYMDYYEKHIVQVQPDSLTALYKKQGWFKKSIDRENGYLLKAISETDKSRTQRFIDSFFVLRNARREETKRKLKFDIEQYEKCYETMEGTARYVEYSLYNKYSTMQPDEKLLKSDTGFKSFKGFKHYKLEDHKWLYLTEKTNYHYAIGFNLARLLDKLNVEYKSRLFNEGSLTMEDLLKSRN